MNHVSHKTQVPLAVQGHVTIFSCRCNFSSLALARLSDSCQHGRACHLLRLRLAVDRTRPTDTHKGPFVRVRKHWNGQKDSLTIHSRRRSNSPENRAQYRNNNNMSLNAPENEAAAHAANSVQANRVFVGNLTYEVRYTDLKDFMSAGLSLSSLALAGTLICVSAFFSRNSGMVGDPYYRTQQSLQRLRVRPPSPYFSPPQDKAFSHISFSHMQNRRILEPRGGPRSNPDPDRPVPHGPQRLRPRGASIFL